MNKSPHAHGKFCLWFGKATPLSRRLFDLIVD